MSTKPTKAEVEEQKELLKSWFPKGSTVYTVLRHVSASGMQREIGVVAILPQDPGNPGSGADLCHPNYAVSTVLGWARSKGDGVKVCGCGMDMGFHLVHELAGVLYGNGYDLKQRWI
jgi:hypothetical protein